MTGPSVIGSPGGPTLWSALVAAHSEMSTPVSPRTFARILGYADICDQSTHMELRLLGAGYADHVDMREADGRLVRRGLVLTAAGLERLARGPDGAREALRAAASRLRP